MGNSGLDHEVRFDVPDDLLRRHDVLWQLDDGPAEPGEVIGVLKATAPLKPGTGQPRELRVLRHPFDHGRMFIIPGAAHRCRTPQSYGISFSNGSRRSDAAGSCGWVAQLA